MTIWTYFKTRSFVQEVIWVCTCSYQDELALKGSNEKWLLSFNSLSKENNVIIIVEYITMLQFSWKRRIHLIIAWLLEMSSLHIFITNSRLKDPLQIFPPHHIGLLMYLSSGLRVFKTESNNAILFRKRHVRCSLNLKMLIHFCCIIINFHDL